MKIMKHNNHSSLKSKTLLELMITANTTNDTELSTLFSIDLAATFMEFFEHLPLN